jgi:hypothetical protein
MENVREFDRGDPAMEEPTQQFQYPGEPTRGGGPIDTPTRLKEGDFLEAVSHAVARELEGGMISLQSTLSHGATTGEIPAIPPPFD